MPDAAAAGHSDASAPLAAKVPARHWPCPGSAASDAALRFDLERQLDATIAWYREIVADWQKRPRRQEWVTARRIRRPGAGRR